MSFLDEVKRLFSNTTDPASPHSEDLLTSLLIMAWVVEARDPYTGGHLWRVSQFSGLLAHKAGLDPRDCSRIALGAFLHDLGKVSVPDHILGKKDKLTDEEYAVIKTHPESGWRMIAAHPLSALAERAIRDHHETPDGRGYPRGLLLKDISSDAKIVGICDAFDAMTSNRPYRNGMPADKALSIIESNLGSQFDEHFGRIFIDMGRAQAFSHIIGHSDSGIPLQSCAMCGSHIAIPRASTLLPHSTVNCPCCTGEHLIDTSKNLLALSPTGRTGSAADMAPKADLDVVADVVKTSLLALASPVVANISPMP